MMNLADQDELGNNPNILTINPNSPLPVLELCLAHRNSAQGGYIYGPAIGTPYQLLRMLSRAGMTISLPVETAE